MPKNLHWSNSVLPLRSTEIQPISGRDRASLRVLVTASIIAGFTPTLVYQSEIRLTPTQSRNRFTSRSSQTCICSHLFKSSLTGWNRLLVVVFFGVFISLLSVRRLRVRWIVGDSRRGVGFPNGMLTGGGVPSGDGIVWRKYPLEQGQSKILKYRAV